MCGAYHPSVELLQCYCVCTFRFLVLIVHVLYVFLWSSYLSLIDCIRPVFSLSLPLPFWLFRFSL